MRQATAAQVLAVLQEVLVRALYHVEVWDRALVTVTVAVDHQARALAEGARRVEEAMELRVEEVVAVDVRRFSKTSYAFNVCDQLCIYDHC